MHALPLNSSQHLALSRTLSIQASVQPCSSRANFSACLNLWQGMLHVTGQLQVIWGQHVVSGGSVVSQGSGCTSGIASAKQAARHRTAAGLAAEAPASVCSSTAGASRLSLRVRIAPSAPLPGLEVAPGDLSAAAAGPGIDNRLCRAMRTWSTAAVLSIEQSVAPASKVASTCRPEKSEGV